MIQPRPWSLGLQFSLERGTCTQFSGHVSKLRNYASNFIFH